MDWQMLATLVGMVASMIGAVWMIENRFEKKIKALGEKIEGVRSLVDEKIDGIRSLVDEKIEGIRSLFIDYIAKK